MTQESTKHNKLPLPLLAAIVVGFTSALVVAFSFEVIKYWPLPASVAPALGFNQGLWWGAIVGAISGLALGFLTDDKHFDQLNK